MQRTFGFDVLACPRRGGRLRLIALIEDAAVIGRILRHLGVSTAIPVPRPARAPPVRVGVRGVVVGTTILRCSTPVPEFVRDGPLVGAPEVCPVARSHAPNEAPRA